MQEDRKDITSIYHEDQDTQLAKLYGLIRNNKLAEIKNIIHLAKEKRGRDWTDSEEYHIQHAIVLAMQLGQVETVRLFLDEGVYVNDFIPLGRILIYYAAQSGHLPIVELLVERRADIGLTKNYHTGDYNNSGIMGAIEKRHVEIVAYLLKKGANSNGVIYGKPNELFLARAARNGDTKIVELLIHHGANVLEAIISAYIVFQENFKKIEIKYNWMKGREEEKKKQLDSLKQPYLLAITTLMDYAIGSDLSDPNLGWDFLKTIDANKVNFLGISIEGHPITHELLREHKIQREEEAIVTLDDLKKVPSPRKNRLLKSISYALKIRGELISSNGIINVVPFLYAIAAGDITAVEIRLKSSETLDLNNGILLAVRRERFEIVKILAKHPKMENAFLMKAFVMSLYNENKNCSEYLFSQLKIDAVDDKGNTLLHLVTAEGSLKQVQFLLDKKPNVNSQDKNKNTPLHLAVKRTDLSVVELLMAHHADVNLVNHQQLTPLALSQKKSQPMENEEHKAIQETLQKDSSVISELIRQRQKIHKLKSEKKDTPLPIGESLPNKRSCLIM